MNQVFLRDQLTCDVCGTPSIAENGKTIGKQNMLYFYHVAIFRSKLWRHKKARDTVHVLFLYHNFLKTIWFLYQNGFVLVIQFK